MEVMVCIEMSAWSFKAYKRVETSDRAPHDNEGCKHLEEAFEFDETHLEFRDLDRTDGNVISSGC